MLPVRILTGSPVLAIQTRKRERMMGRDGETEKEERKRDKKIYPSDQHEYLRRSKLDVRDDE